MIDLTKINPNKAYSVKETADLIGMNPASLRRKIGRQENDAFIANTKPADIGGAWIFNGQNLLNALGTPPYNNQDTNNYNSTAGAVTFNQKK